MGPRILIQHWRLGCVDRAEVAAEVANGDESSSSWLLYEVAFDCELVTCSCYLLLLCGLMPSPLPHTKAGRGNQLWDRPPDRATKQLLR